MKIDKIFQKFHIFQVVHQRETYVTGFVMGVLRLTALLKNVIKFWTVEMEATRITAGTIRYPQHLAFYSIEVST